MDFNYIAHVICDRVRENQAFGQKFCFADYAGFRSAYAVYIIVENLKAIARLPTELRLLLFAVFQTVECVKRGDF